MKVQAYLDAIKLKLATSPSIKEAHVVQERSLEDRGFFRARLHLVNADFVEVAEFFVIALGEIQTVEFGDTDTVEPGHPMGVVAFIDVLERMIGETA